MSARFCEYFEASWSAECGRRASGSWTTHISGHRTGWSYCRSHRWRMLVWLNVGGHRVLNLPDDPTIRAALAGAAA